jgi:arylsulfatase A-like enzyme
VERGVRFVQLYHTDWDHHGVEGRTLGKDLEDRCREVDRAGAALISDLKQRGLLDQTMVVWGGEFGRTPIGERTDVGIGRNHHVQAGSLWLAGGGIRPIDYGQSDELGFFAQENPVGVHDLHATLLAALGLNHWTLTYRSQGRDFRLSDTGGRVIEELLG